MVTMKKDKILHYLFITSIIFKIIDGILEFIGGVALLFIKSDQIVNLVRIIFQHELVQDPTDLLANFLILASRHLTSGSLSFASVYLIIHGIIKIALVTALLLKKSWAYPVAGIVLSIFVIYQFIRFFNTHSLVLLFLTMIDIVIIILLRSEYRRVKRSKG